MQDASLSKSSEGDVRVFFEDFIEICSVIKATFKSDIKDIHIGDTMGFVLAEKE